MRKLFKTFIASNAESTDPGSNTEQCYPGSEAESNYPDSNTEQCYPGSEAESNYPDSNTEQSNPDSDTELSEEAKAEPSEKEENEKKTEKIPDSNEELEKLKAEIKILQEEKAELQKKQEAEVAAAFRKGELKGRNAKIEEKYFTKSNEPDIPQIFSGKASLRKDEASIFDLARNARSNA